MLVLLHVIIAISGLVYTGYVYFSPSKTKIYGASALITATLISGTILVFVSHAPLLTACMTGLLYLGVTSIGLAASYKKLAKESAID